MTIDLPDFSWIQLSFVDVFGASHSMLLPADRFDVALAEGIPFDGSVLEGRARLIETDMRLRPDATTLVPLGDGIARVVCTVLGEDGEPWPGDPRTSLERVLDSVGELGEDYVAAAELEFYLLDYEGRPLDSGGYFGEAAGSGMETVRRAADRLGSFGVPIDSVHHEAGPGQYEIDIAQLSALRLADALVLAKQIVRQTAEEAGLHATFMPRPIPDEPGSGLHLQQRVGSHLVDADGRLTDEGSYFLAGQLAHARPLSALACPTVNSYKRLHSGPEAPGAVIWAHVNRGALLRLSNNIPGDATLEYRAADPSANPYLLLAGLLVAGAHGLGTGLELPPAVEEAADGFDPAASDSSRLEPLPRDLDEALRALLLDDVLVDAFDGQLISRLVDARRAEADDYRAQITPWEIERYLDEA